jgi:NodT family efflux transporter outer membrane factor (OMF) lipoprotein
MIGEMQTGYSRLIALVALALPLGGCLLTERVDPALDIPVSYRAGPKNAAAAEKALPRLDWWSGFRSRELTDIIEEARIANLDIAAAIARIVQADAQARIAGAALLPTVGLNGSASRSRASQSTGTGGATGGSERSSYSASLSASYEIDFWGKNRAALRSAEETAAASRFDREVVALTTVAATANAYFQVLTAQERLGVARRNITSAQRVLDLIRQRLTAGTASELDTSQQESLLATQRASVPQLELSLQQNANALALLIASPPSRESSRGGSVRAISIPRLTPGLPSELIAQRPDIRQAEASLAAANADVENARAAMLPSITLTGEGGYQSAVLKTLMRPESALFNLAGGLTQPIFDGQRLQGQLDLSKGRQDELLQTYRKAVISGFTDVENALAAIQQNAARERYLQAAVIASRRAFEISETRLREGTVDLVTVLQTQQSLFQAEDQLVQARLARLQAVVSLYQALGGGWLPKPVDASNDR